MFTKSLSIYCCVVLLFITAGSAFSADKVVEVHWLGGDASKAPVGVSFGVPFEKGRVTRKTQLSMKDAQGKDVPIASWPMAYWPDGSVKWMGTGCVADGKFQAPFLVRPNSDQDKGKLTVKENYDYITINTGKFSCKINKKSDRLIEYVNIAGKVISENLRITAHLKNTPDPKEKHILSKEYVSKFRKVSLEYSSSVRAVVKAQGVLHCDSSGRDLLPFTLRLYFYSGSNTVKAVFSFVYNGDKNRDFIAGLGMKVDIPMRQDLLNRHVIYSGQGEGTWHEAVRLMAGRPSTFRKLYEEGVYETQMKGRAIAATGTYSPARRKVIRNLPRWNDYKMVQNSADSFTIFKRADEKCCWLKAGWGRRSRGVAFAGDTTGGVIMGARDFWQSYPSSIEINNTATNKAEMTIWLWPPDAQPMDLRHYDTEAHSLKAVYEDYEEGHSTPYGIARTSVITLGFEDKVPDLETFNDYADMISDPPLLVCKPEYYHSVGVFGIWSLPDRSTESKKQLEEKLDTGVNYYLQEVEQRHWYGFWDYGDVMHQYDAVRHQWKYDIGGYAWANTELAPNMWLWYSFLRTGRKDIFRMAEAMTRHTQEVDTYHTGKMKGLGTRHNVSHWGGGAKEARVSHAGFHRFYYYLTADERTADVMDEVINADYACVNVPPLRKIIKDYFEKQGLDPNDYDYPTYIRSGPDWISFVANWMSAWERTGDKKYLNWIMTGMNDFVDMPFGLHTSFIYGYDPETKHLYPVTKPDSPTAHHLMVTMGGYEVMAELNRLIDNPQWQKVWLEFCERYNWSSSKWRQETGLDAAPGGFPGWHARLTAYAAYKNNDPELAARAWNEFLNNKGLSEDDRFPSEPIEVSGASVLNKLIEVPDATTNHYSQWSLNAIELLELVGDYIPEISD